MWDHLLSATSHKGPPIQNTKLFPVKALQLEPPPVNDHNHFLGATVNDFPSFLTSSKQPLDAFFDLGYFCCVHKVKYLEYL